MSSLLSTVSIGTISEVHTISNKNIYLVKISVSDIILLGGNIWKILKR